MGFDVTSIRVGDYLRYVGTASMNASDRRQWRISRRNTKGIEFETGGVWDNITLRTTPWGKEWIIMPGCLALPDGI
jgi:hypothetical protein